MPAPGPTPVHIRLLEITVRALTSGLGGVAALIAALVLVLTQFRTFTEKPLWPGAPPWLGLAVLVGLVVLALVAHTIPQLFAQRRIKRTSELTGTLETGYFTLRPRDDPKTFARADGAHNQILHWIETTREPVLYLTGQSGTGKSSLLSAWVLPKRREQGCLVLEFRGYEDVLARLEEEITKPGVIWDRPPKAGGLYDLLQRAANKSDKPILIVVDQFEEYLLLQDDAQRAALQQFLSMPAISGVTFLLVYRPEYEGMLLEQTALQSGWPRMTFDVNRKVISAFTQKAAQKFLDDSGLHVDPDLQRAVLHEASEIEEGARGLIRPVTINLCGLVLSRPAGQLPRQFRGGIIRGFLREALTKPAEVRDAAPKLIPLLITANSTKQPRTIAQLAEASLLSISSVRACLWKLGEKDCALVRPLGESKDEQQETWEISHDFLVPLLDVIVARGTRSLWFRTRPWLPWAAAAAMGLAAVAIPLTTRQDSIAELSKQGWSIQREEDVLWLQRDDNIPPKSISILSSLPPPLGLYLHGPKVTDLSALRTLKNLTGLYVDSENVTDVSPLRELKKLTFLSLSGTNVADVSGLRDLTKMTYLSLGFTKVRDLTPLTELGSLKELDLWGTNIRDLAPLRGLQNLRRLTVTPEEIQNLTPLFDQINHGLVIRKEIF